MSLAAPEDFRKFSLSSLPHRQLAALADAGEILSQQVDSLALLALLLHAEPEAQQEVGLLALNTEVAELQAQWRQVIRAQQLTAQYQQLYPEGNWCDILR
ncbi:MAG: hypothetical protein KH811_09195, partial [Veillonella sp.]|nr:hypothetical protein [Veillonella sp.]